MESIAAKAEFLRNEYIPKLRQLDADTPGKWGKFNVQQMVEHMSWSMRQANGRDIYTIVTPADMVPKWQAFLMSEKQFRENTANQLLADEPEPLKKSSLEDAIAELDDEVKHFFTVFDAEPGRVITNPLFGDLTYEMWVQLLHKHAWHHLRQFGIEGQK